MDRIKSFEIDHDFHDVGFYGGEPVNGIYTYDLRFRKPNCGDYLSNAVLHSIEHIFATVIRNGRLKESVVYFGPMGCRTGFYLLLNGISYFDAQKLVKETLEDSLKVTSVPGSGRKECGNYQEHDFAGALKEMEAYLRKLNAEKA